jgi:hypothetical protein
MLVAWSTAVAQGVALLLFLRRQLEEDPTPSYWSMSFCWGYEKSSLLFVCVQFPVVYYEYNSSLLFAMLPLLLQWVPLPAVDCWIQPRAIQTPVVFPIENYN